jgi:hypothetical protein
MFGPWESSISPAERLARLGALRALAGVFATGNRNSRPRSCRQKEATRMCCA